MRAQTQDEAEGAGLSARPIPSSSLTPNLNVLHPDAALFVTSSKPRNHVQSLSYLKPRSDLPKSTREKVDEWSFPSCPAVPNSMEQAELSIPYLSFQ